MIVIITVIIDYDLSQKTKTIFLGLIGSTKKIEDTNYINLLHGNSFKHYGYRANYCNTFFHNDKICVSTWRSD